MSDVSVFGFSMTADGFKVAISMSLIVFFVAVSHFLLSVLDEVVNASAFQGAIQPLYKDLVVMGISSFILTMINSGGLSTESWLVYLQIADITLFISTFFHVLFAVCLVFANGYHMRAIRDHLSRDVHKLVSRYQNEKQSRFQSWQPFNSLRSQMELRVLRITFLSKFNLSRSFDFARYITIAEENNIIRMLEVSPSRWAVFLTVLVSLCVGFTVDTKEHHKELLARVCDSFNDEDSVDMYNKCKLAWYQSLLFTSGTGLMFLFTACLAVASRVYVLRLLRQSGYDTENMDQFLLDDEVADLENKNEDRISYKELKTAISRIKLSQKERKPNKAKQLWKKTKLVQVITTMRTVAEVHDIEVENSPPMTWSDVGTPIEQKPSSDRTVHLDSSMERRATNIMDASSQKCCVVEDSEQRRNSDVMRDRRLKLMHAGIRSGIFVFNSPDLYFMLRDTSNMMLCMFMAFHVVTFGPTSQYTDDAIMWNILPLLCLLGALGCQVYTIRSSSLIFSFYQLDTEIVGKVVEEKEELESIETTLRDKLLNKIQNASGEFNEVAEVALIQLFNEIQVIDGEADGYISRHEFRALLERLNIHYTARRFDDAFGLIDKQADGFITLMEFHGFIFPSHASEQQRQNRIKKMAEVGRMELPAGMFAAPKKTRRDGLTKIMLMKSDQTKKEDKAESGPPVRSKKAQRKLPQFLRDMKNKYSATNLHIGGIGRNRSGNKICDSYNSTTQEAGATSSHSIGEPSGGDSKSRDFCDEESSGNNLQILQSFIDEEEDDH